MNITTRKDLKRWIGEYYPDCPDPDDLVDAILFRTGCPPFGSPAWAQFLEDLPETDWQSIFPGEVTLDEFVNGSNRVHVVLILYGTSCESGHIIPTETGYGGREDVYKLNSLGKLRGDIKDGIWEWDGHDLPAKLEDELGSCWSGKAYESSELWNEAVNELGR